MGTDGKKEDCIVCYWVEPQKPMILNATNAKQIQKLLNTPYIRTVGRVIKGSSRVGEKVKGVR